MLEFGVSKCLPAPLRCVLRRRWQRSYSVTCATTLMPAATPGNTMELSWIWAAHSARITSWMRMSSSSSSDWTQTSSPLLSCCTSTMTSLRADMTEGHETTCPPGDKGEQSVGTLTLNWNQICYLFFIIKKTFINFELFAQTRESFTSWLVCRPQASSLTLCCSAVTL